MLFNKFFQFFSESATFGYIFREKFQKDKNIFTKKVKKNNHNFVIANKLIYQVRSGFILKRR